MPYIATTYSSTKKVETLKTNLLLPFIPRTTYSTNSTTNDHNCTTSTSQSSSQHQLIPLPEDTIQNISFLQYSNTDVIHDHKKSPILIQHKIVQYVQIISLFILIVDTIPTYKTLHPGRLTQFNQLLYHFLVL